MSKTKISYADVIDFFENADFDLASLTHQLVSNKLDERVSKREAAGERMKKARAGRKPKGEVAVATEAAATPIAQTSEQAPAQAQTQANRRPHAVSA